MPRECPDITKFNYPFRKDDSSGALSLLYCTAEEYRKKIDENQIKVIEEEKEFKGASLEHHNHSERPDKFITFEGQEEKVLKIIVPGRDGRQRVHNTKDWPYRVHGRLELTFETEDGRDVSFNGSGTLVGPYHVLTAGHNLYTHDYYNADRDTRIRKKWAKSISFVPGQGDNEKPFGVSSIAAMLSVKGWIDDRDVNYDFGMLILNRYVGLQTGWFGLLSTSDSKLASYKINVTGYPGEYPGGSGKSLMWTMEGPVRGTTDAKVLRYDIDTSPGQSGSGVWISSPTSNQYQIAAVHVRGEYTPEKKGNEASRITKERFNLLHGWIQNYARNVTIPAEDWRGRLNFKNEDDKNKFAQLYSKSFRSSKITFRELEDKHISPLVGLLNANPQVSSLTLRRQDNQENDQLGDIGLSALFFAKHLREVQIWRTELGDWGAAKLASMENLKRLYIMVSKVGDLGARFFGQNSSITDLTIGSSKITDKGAQIIARENKILTHIDLQGNRIGTVGARAFQNHPALKSLNLGGTTGGSELGDIFSRVSLKGKVSEKAMLTSV